MAEHSLPQIHGVAMRLTEMDETGAMVPGDDNVYVSKALTLLTVTPVYLDGTETTDRNAADELCLDYRGDDSFRRVDAQVELCTQDPILSAFFAGTLLGNPADVDNRLGWAMPPIGVLTAKYVGVEVWARRINRGVMDPDFPYAWHLLPFTKGWRPGPRSLNVARQANIFTGQGYETTSWFDGPTDDWPSSSDRAYQWVEATADEVPTAFGAFDLAAS